MYTEEIRASVDAVFAIFRCYLFSFLNVKLHFEISPRKKNRNLLMRWSLMHGINMIWAPASFSYKLPECVICFFWNRVVVITVLFFSADNELFGVLLLANTVHVIFFMPKLLKVIRRIWTHFHTTLPFKSQPFIDLLFHVCAGAFLIFLLSIWHFCDCNLLCFHLCHMNWWLLC